MFKWKVYYSSSFYSSSWPLLSVNRSMPLLKRVYCVVSVDKVYHRPSRTPYLWMTRSSLVRPLVLRCKNMCQSWIPISTRVANRSSYFSVIGSLIVCVCGSHTWTKKIMVRVRIAGTLPGSWTSPSSFTPSHYSIELVSDASVATPTGLCRDTSAYTRHLPSHYWQSLHQRPLAIDSTQLDHVISTTSIYSNYQVARAYNILSQPSLSPEASYSYLSRLKYACVALKVLSCIWKCFHNGLPAAYTCAHCGCIAVETNWRASWDCLQYRQVCTPASDYLHQNALWSSWPTFLWWLCRTNFKQDTLAKTILTVSFTEAELEINFRVGCNFL